MSSDDIALDTARIDALMDASAVADIKILLVGAGSGGSFVLQRLAMCGFRRWTIIDPDVLEPENLVKHPGRRADIGLPKVKVMADWLHDRNPAVEVTIDQADVKTSDVFTAALPDTDLIISATDSAVARRRINAAAVEARIPCVTATVYRTGLGGEVFAYIPDEGGCYSCKELVSAKSQIRIEDIVDLTDEEEEAIYGLQLTDFQTSGLAVDISVVASFHAHYIVSLLSGRYSTSMTIPSFNWLTIGLRRIEGAFPSLYAIERTLLRPQEACYVGCGAKD
jgi:molybdopterin/thiamine biosynthesis adenylyltransferase